MTKRDAKRFAYWVAAQALRGDMAAGWEPVRDWHEAAGLGSQPLPGDEDIVSEALHEIVGELERRGRRCAK